MSADYGKFRDNLISLEQFNPEIHQHYLEEMEKMFTQEITGVRKFGWWARDLFLFLVGLVLMSSAIFDQPISLPIAGRWLWGLSGAFTLGIALLGMRLAWKKKIDLRNDSKFIALVGSSGMTVVAFSIMFAAFIMRDLQNMTTMVPIALLAIIIGILIGLDNRVQQGELNTREKLLEIEYRLAALDERLQSGKGGKN
ncbi:MAG: hypothetical protein A3F83_11920 [Candidatus Glassbacteria bacterium RIFCSPLOWO2_12_FULL_58_11]|uniref:Uncharacterized protein n=1 Tax=Candidatus Glassbacteria bacterium RIFCSPLOWO2_12_FULL_58_11 TaxID=1817867 RepID=A0A1F5Z1S5_9BACT|nr:MAG: hypothetical protein A3F83_11920 [Candidatus Glassbacteria bacterium RIFCSPLOWO2_12_FULL_58_11]